MRFALRRLATAVVLLWLVLTLTFVLLHLTPGDPAKLSLDPRVSPQQVERLRTAWGLDRSLTAQYLDWIVGAVRGDLGVSIRQHRPVSAVLWAALPPTLLLAGAALLVQFGLGVAGGIAAARNVDSWIDHALRLLAQTLYATPVFWLGLMAILLVAEKAGWLPPGGMTTVHDEGAAPWLRLGDLLRHLALPALVLGVASAGRIVRYTRNSLLETMSEGFVQAAMARGLSAGASLRRHALRASLSPLLHAFGLALPALLSGTLVVEVVFAWPGLGRTTYDAILARDYPLILASTALAGSLVVVGNLLADLLQAAADPRVRHG